MDEPQFTVRKHSSMIAVGTELLEPAGPPPRPRFRWPSFICGYEHSDDYYSEGHSCELPVGHDGPHRCSLEWETRPADVCRAQGHVWGEWAPLGVIAGFMVSAPFQTKAPTKQRECGRCGQRDTDGEYDYSPLFPSVRPIAMLPRAMTEWKFEPEKAT